MCSLKLGKGADIHDFTAAEDGQEHRAAHWSLEIGRTQPSVVKKKKKTPNPKIKQSSRAIRALVNVTCRPEMTTRKVPSEFSPPVGVHTAQRLLSEHEFIEFGHLLVGSKLKPRFVLGHSEWARRRGGLMVWSGISWRGKFPLVFIKGFMDALAYTTIMDDTVLPFVQKYYLRGITFQQDGAPAH